MIEEKRTGDVIGMMRIQLKRYYQLTKEDWLTNKVLEDIVRASRMQGEPQN